MHSGLVWTFLLAAPAYALGVHAFAWRARIHHGPMLFVHMVPTMVAAFTAWIFLVRGGETVAQFAAGDAARESVWSAWMGAWPALLIALGAAGSVHVMGTLFAAVHRATRRWLLVTVPGAALCACGLGAVFALAPTA